MGWRRGLCAAGFVAFGLVACSLGLDGDLTSGEQRPDGAVDASLVVEGGGSTPMPPSPPEVDASADVDVPPPCPSKDPSVILCDDFERPDASAPFGWTEFRNNGTLTIEASVGMRGSHGLRARQVTEGGGWALSSGLRRTIETQWPLGRELSVEFDFQLAAMDGDGFILMEQYFGDSWGVAAYKQLECPSAAVCVSWGNQYIPGKEPPWAKAYVPRFGVFHHAKTMMVRTAEGRTGSIVIDGQVVREGTVSSDTNDAKVDLSIGALFGTGTFDVIIDDVVVRRVDP